MRALVTGAAGFIGSHLAERLVARGDEVVGVDAFTPFYARGRKERNLEALRGHPRFHLHERPLERAPLDDLLDGVDVVFHLAAQAGVRPSFGGEFAAYVHHNVLATQRLLEAVVAHPVRRFVYASSSSVYGTPDVVPTGEGAPLRPRSPYGLTKVATEELAGVYHRTAGVPVVGLRYFTVYGPRQRPDMAFSRFFDDALEGRPLTILGDGRQLRDFTFVGDAVDGTLAAAADGRPGEVYNIGGGRPVQLLDAVGRIAAMVPGVRVRHRPAARGDVRRTCADGRLAVRDLGFAPRTRLEEGLDAQLRWRLGGAAPAPGRDPDVLVAATAP